MCTDHQKVRPKSNDLEVGIFMAKYSFEFKKKVVLEYLDGKGGALYLFKNMGLLLVHSCANGLMHTVRSVMKA